MKGKEKLFNFNLQLFADGEGGENGTESQDNSTDEKAPNNEPAKDTEKNTEIESLKTQISELSKIIEELKSNKKTEPEPNKNKEDKETDPMSEIEKLKAELAKKDLIYQTEKLLVKEGFAEYSESLMPIVMKDDVKTTEKNIKTLKTVIEKLTQAKIEDLKKGRSLKGTGSDNLEHLESEIENILSVDKTGIPKIEDFWR
ncbi:DUF4355 domain-containing protein [Marinitoga sp. 1155]|uniref:DUF4355 domain-containing protein n=1 Tax=Marinitoga sp. 1155 TaxID=1428448 RepID=UPI000641636D|nr:DUF4355 domain-containing protein [Marinitoga sp. 1155]AJW76991.1 chaperone protein DnaK [Marinitoga camini virus 2]KLO24815.1 hypothetical protein X274_02390 [Marinitoga sp. 1155]